MLCLCFSVYRHKSHVGWLGLGEHHGVAKNTGFGCPDHRCFGSNKHSNRGGLMPQTQMEMCPGVLTNILWSDSPIWQPSWPVMNIPLIISRWWLRAKK